MAKKRKCLGSKKSNHGVDRLSNLPIALIHHVLSFLSTLDVVRASLLSKVWRYVWRSQPTLEFPYYLPHQGTQNHKFVDFVLQHRDDSGIHRFELFANEKQVNHSVVNCWIVYALEHNVEVLDLGLYWFDSVIVLTHLISECATLREFTLYSSFQERVYLPFACSLRNLRILNFEKVSFDEDHRDLFTDVPNLEILVFEDCYFERDFKLIVCGPKLRKFTLKGRCTSLDISAPNLVSLYLDYTNVGYFYSGTINFNGSIISLPEALLGLPPPSSDKMINIFKMLKNASSISLSASFLLEIGEMLQTDPDFVKCIQTPSHNLEILKVGSLFTETEILAINTIVKYTPGIIALVIENQEGEDISQPTSRSRNFN